MIKSSLRYAVSILPALLIMPAVAANINLDTASETYEIGADDTWIINKDATLAGTLTGSGTLAARPSSPGITDAPEHGDTVVTVTGDISQFTGTFHAMQYGNKMNNAEQTPLPNAVSTVVFKTSTENGVNLDNNGIFIFDGNGLVKINSHTNDSGQARIFLNNNTLDKNANTKSFVFLAAQNADINGGYTATLEGYNTPASIYVGGTNNTVNGDVTTVAKNSSFGNLYGNGWNSDVKGNISLTAENVDVSHDIVGNITQGGSSLELKSLVDGNINVLVKNSTVGAEVKGQDFTFNGTTQSGTKGTTTITVENSVIGSVRGANTNAGNQEEYGKNYFNLNDVVVTVKDSVIKDEVLAMGSYIGSAGSTTLNIIGKNAIGYTDWDGTKSSTGAKGDVEVFAGSKRGATIQGDTTINMDTAGANTIDVLGMVNAGAHSGGGKDGYVLGKSTLNLDNSGSGVGYVNAYTFESHNAAGGSTMNLTNINANASVKTEGFDVINIDDSSVLTTAQLIMPENSTINMTLTSADKHAVLDVTNSYTGGATINMLFDGAGTYNDVLLHYASDIDLSQSSSLFDIAKSGADIVVSVKSTEDIAADNGVSADTAVLLSNLADAPSDVLTNVSLAAQDALANGRADYVEQELSKLTPEVKPVAQTVALSAQNQVVSLVADRMTGMTGRSGGDVALTGGGVWAQGLFNKSKLNEVFHGYTRGVAAGIDEIIAHDLTLGLGYAHSDTDVHVNNGRNTDITSNTLFLYAQYKPNQWFVNGLAQYTLSTYKENADVFGIAKSSKHDVDSFGGSITTGYRFASGAIPELGLRYLHVAQNEYVDSFGTGVKADNTDMLTSVAGVKYVFDIFATNALVLHPELRAAATYDILSDKSNATIVMPGAAAYTLDGDRLSRVGGEFGIGLAANWSGIELSVAYDLNIHKDYTSQTGKLKFRYNF